MPRLGLILLPLALAACAPPPNVVRLTPVPQDRLGSPDAFGPGILAATPRDVRLALARPGHVLVLRVSAAGELEAVRPRRAGGRTSMDAGIHRVKLRPVVTRRPVVSRVTRPRTQAPEDPVGEPRHFRDCEMRAERVRRVAPRDSTGQVMSDRAEMESNAVYQACLSRLSSRSRATVSPIGRLAVAPAAEMPGGYWLVIVSDVDPGEISLPHTIWLLDKDATLEDAVRRFPGELLASRAPAWAAYVAAIP